MSPLFILQNNESCFSNWTRSSYSESLRHVTNLVERRWTSSRSFISFFSHGRLAWNEYSKWGRMNAPYNLARVHYSWEYRRFVRHDLPCLKPCCLVLIICFEPTNRVRATLVIRSITFKHLLVRLTGRKFFGSTRWPPL